MIYNWTPIAYEDLKLMDASREELAKLIPDNKSDTQYIIVDVTAEQLVDKDKRHVYPTTNDVFVRGDDAYGLDRVLSSHRSGTRWTFKLLIHKLKKEKFSEPKSFARPQA